MPLYNPVTASSVLPVADTQTVIKGSSDATKLLRFEVDGFTTGTTRILTPPDASATVAGLEVAQTFTGTPQTFTADIVSSFGYTHIFTTVNESAATAYSILRPYQPMTGSATEVYFTLPPTAGSSGQFLTTNGVAGGGNYNYWSTPAHSGLSGLASDDHTQYALLAGRSGGQTLIGGTASGNNLVLQSSSHATRGVVSFTDRPTAPFGSGANNERFGAQSGRDAATGTDNTAIGYQALKSLTGGSYNVALGGRALQANTTGQQNVALGEAALYANTEGSYNFALGVSALVANLTGSYNVGIGTLALLSLQSGVENIGIGPNALRTVVSGSYNIGIGRAAGFSVTGNGNVGIGENAIYYVSSGNYNVGIGYQSGQGVESGVALTTGAGNVLIGYNADVAANSQNYGIALGYEAVCGAGEFALGPYITSQGFYALSSTSTLRAQGKIKNTWGVSTDASREGILSLYGVDYNGDRLGIQITGDGTNTELGFYGVTPVARPAAYTQTYSTADRTHANPTAVALTVADGAGTNDATIGTITADASVIAAVQELADQHNKLVADMADLKQLVNSIIDDLQSLGLAQ